MTAVEHRETPRTITLIGVPSSAGSYAAGQDLAPQALRSAGLVSALTAAGLDVRDAGDLPHRVWRPDRGQPFAQNVDDVVATLTELTARLTTSLADSDLVLVVGGNCTIALSVVASLWEAGKGRPGLVYVDRGYDLNTPSSTTDGALDWMGMAHALDLPGCVEPVLNAFAHRPLLTPDRVHWLGIDPAMTTEWERRQADALDLRATSSRDFAASPGEAVQAALDALACDVLGVHFDVDVLDFTDAPLAENTDGRNTGPTLDQATEGLRCAMRDVPSRVLSVGELNPTRSAGAPEVLPRFVDALVRILADRPI